MVSQPNLSSILYNLTEGIHESISSFGVRWDLGARLIQPPPTSIVAVKEASFQWSLQLEGHVSKFRIERIQSGYVRWKLRSQKAKFVQRI